MYIEKNNIKDIVFESDKIKKMLIELKKQRIGVTEIAKFLNISIKRLKKLQIKKVMALRISENVSRETFEKIK